MDLYHIWCDLKPGVRDTTFVDAIDKYLGNLRDGGLIETFRVTRRKLGLGAPGLGEFHVWIETRDLAQLDAAFTRVSSRADPVEGFHHGVNSLVENTVFALYRDFPDPHRQHGEERF